MAGIYVKYPATSGGSTGSSTGVQYQVGPLDGAAANSNGATIGSNFLYMQSATSTTPGVVSSASQEFSGTKRFNSSIAVGSISFNQLLSVGQSGGNSAHFVGNISVGDTVAPNATVDVTKTQNAVTSVLIQNITNDTAAVARGQVVAASASMVFFAAPPAYTGITEFAGKSGLYTASNFPSSNLVLSARGTSSGIDFYTGGAASSNKRVVIDSSGNVAIGSSTPDSRLCITGPNVTMTFENTTNSPSKSYFGTYNLGSISLIQLSSNRRTSDAFIFDPNRAPSYLNVTSAFNDSYITFWTSSQNNTEPAERVRIDSSGNVGIKTALPTVKLDVRGSGLFYNDLAVTGSTSLRIQEGAGQANSEVFGVYSNDLATTRMNIRNGVVCVGSTTPTALLNVSSSSGLSAFFSGNVGIGVLAPSQKLDVVGNIKGNGFIVGSTTVTASTGGSAYSIKLPGTQGSNSSVLANDGAGNLNWQVFGGAPQSYTPTIAGVGTVSSVYFTAQRIHGSAVIRGTFTTGTGFTAAALTIGLPAGMAVSNSMPPVYTYVGQAASEGITAFLPLLARSGDTVLSMGANSGPACLTPQNGTSNYLALSKGSIYAIIPVEGWT